MIDLDPSLGWFAQPVEQRDEDYTATIPAQLADIWSEVRDMIGPERFDPVFGEIRPGRFTRASDTAWAQTNGEKPEDFVNLTLELEASELSLNLVGGFDEQFRRVEAWLRKAKSWRYLRAHPELMLVVFVRHATAGPTGRVVWKGAKWSEQYRVLMGDISPIDISTKLTALVARLDGRIEKAAIHVRRPWSPSELGAMADASEIAAEVESWIEPIQEIRVTPSQAW